MHSIRWQVIFCLLILIAINAAIASKLFGLEYTGYHGSNEGTYIAMARIMAEHPGEWKWWPFWSGGMRFENTYLPLTQWLTAVVMTATGKSAGRSFHIVSAFFYVLGPVTLFSMAWIFSRRLWTSFFAALVYSCFSISTFLLPIIRADAGNPWIIRRFQVLTYYGEAPHTVVLALLPFAIICFYMALTRESMHWKILTGIAAAAVSLTNAFGIVALMYSMVSLVLSMKHKVWWKPFLTLAIIGILCLSWISPWLSPTMIHAIRVNTPTVDGDYRYTTGSWISLVIFTASYLCLWWGLRRESISFSIRFFVLASYVPTFIVTSYLITGKAIIAQPHRYHLQMDLLIPVAVVFIAVALLNHLPQKIRWGMVAVCVALLSVQVLHAIHFGRTFIQAPDVTQLVEYQIAVWMNKNRPGQKAFITGSSSYWYNIFSNNPQFHGSHDPSTQNTFIKIPVFHIHSGMNAGDKDAEYSLLWLKAFGARAISVSGPEGQEAYHPIVNYQKFDGLLPEIWRSGDDVIYEVPARSASLAHVIPSNAVVSRKPEHGLDVDPIRPFVEALENPEYPIASFQWKSLHEAEIYTKTIPDQFIAVQITYDPGWEATHHGKRMAIFSDELGQMIIDPSLCEGDCNVKLLFTGGTETTLTRSLSILTIFITIFLFFHGKKRKTHESISR